MAKEVFFLQADADHQGVLEVMLQLRSQYDHQSLAAQIDKQMASGYQVVYVKENNEILAVAGFVVGEKLAWGKHIYIDDLVTNAKCRSTGVGAFLIDWFKSYAKQIGCQQLHLDSGVQRFAAHRFYLREHFAIASHHFSITELNH